MLFDTTMTLLAITSLTAMDYLLPLADDLSQSSKIAALIVPTIIIGFFVSVSRPEIHRKSNGSMLLIQTIYGCAINFSNEFTNMSSTYIYIQQAGNSLGNMTLPTIAGNLTGY